MRRAVHFGGGSLGLGLVVATLEAAGLDVTVVDTDAALVAALTERGGYDLEVHEGAQVTRRFVRIADAMTTARAPVAFARALATADLITTSVRVQNLPAVARALDAADAWRERPDGHVRVVACENLVGSSRTLASALDSVVTWPAERRDRTFLDAEVDRICQTAWPARLAVATEPFAEWVVQDASGDFGPVPGVDVVADLAPYFDRKRAFVNAVADACAFLGRARGHAYLHEAVGDPLVRAEVAGLVRDLVAFVARWPDFDRDGLERYAERALARLANAGIARRIDTVARDLVRKLGRDERFVAPALGLLDAGVAPVGLARVVATLLAGDPAAATLDWVQAWGGDARAERLWALVAAERARGA